MDNKTKTTYLFFLKAQALAKMEKAFQCFSMDPVALQKELDIQENKMLVPIQDKDLIKRFKVDWALKKQTFLTRSLLLREQKETEEIKKIQLNFVEKNIQFRTFAIKNYLETGAEEELANAKFAASENMWILHQKIKENETLFSEDEKLDIEIKSNNADFQCINDFLEKQGNQKETFQKILEDKLFKRILNPIVVKNFKNSFLKEK